MSRLMSGYIDRSGEFAIAPTLRTAPRFTAGLANAVPFGSWDFGFIDDKGGWLLEPSLQFFGGWSDGVASFNVGGKSEEGKIVGGAWGWVGDGRVLCEARFDDVGAFKHDLIAIREDGRWGYADKTGELRIPATFDWAGTFSAEGVAAVAVGGKEGYIRPDGSFVLPATFDAAHPVSQGRGRVRDGDGFVYIDMEGNRLTDPFDEALPFIDGMAKVRRGETWGFIDRSGRLLGDAWFDQADHAARGLAPVRRGNDWFFLDGTGTLHGPYANALPASEGLGRFVARGEGVGFLAPDGSIAIPPRYQSARGFIDGFAAVKRDDLWTFIDAKGTEIAPPHWERPGEFSEGLAAVRRDGKWGVIDASGTTVIEPRFASLGTWSCGVAAARELDCPTPNIGTSQRWTSMPSEGLAHRGFADATAADEMRMTVCFARTPEPDASLRMQQVFSNFQAWLEANHDGAVLARKPWIADYALSVRIKNVDAPAASLQLLLDELAAADLPIQEVVTARFRDDPSMSVAQAMYKVMPAVPHPDDPMGETMFPSFPEYAQAAFDLSQPAPRSESFQHLLAGRWLQAYGELAFDERVLTLYRDDVRICYGVAQPEAQPEDDRTLAVRAAVDAALQRTFDRDKLWVFPGNHNWQPPIVTQRDGAPGVERIELEGRRGYMFGIDTVDLLQDIGPDIFRYREPELMDALASAVAELGLHKVIMWQRFGNAFEGPSYPGIAHPMQPTVYVINLWEA